MTNVYPCDFSMLQFPPEKNEAIVPAITSAIASLVHRYYSKGK